MIHVCFCFHDNTGLYSKFTGTAMFSLFENVFAPPYSITVHILHDNTLTNDNRDKFSYLAGRFNQLVKFYNVEELCADRIAEIRKYLSKGADNKRFTIGMFYRLFIPFVLPPEVEKTIYLDGDIIVTMDINEFWQVELGDKPLGVVTCPPIALKGIVKEEDYFNSGVLLMNLKTLRNEEETITNGMKFFSKNLQHLKWADQDLLNYCFSTRAMKLPSKFNCYLNFLSNRKTVERKIYHYLGCGLSLNMDTSDPFNRLWISYFIRTPFFDADSIGKLYNEILKIRNELKNSARKLSSLVSGKSRGFFIQAEKTDWLKKTFSIRNDEAIIPAENEDSIKKLIDIMKVIRGKYVFFIMTDNFPNSKPFPFDMLTKEGFVEGVDFVKGWQYLNSSLYSYSLIQAM